MATQLWLIPLFPLLGFVLNLLLGRTLGRTFTTLVGPLAVLAALGQSVWACIALWSGSAATIQETLWRWIHIGDLQLAGTKAISVLPCRCLNWLLHQCRHARVDALTIL